MSGSDGATDFSTCWLDVTRRSDQNRVSVQFLRENFERLAIEGASSIFSVGPGNGEVDEGLISMLPDVRDYWACEPDAAIREALEEKLDPYKNRLTLHLSAESLEDHSGPDKPVDIILMVHVCYYFRDTFKQQLKKVLGWLRPGGKAILIHKRLSTFRQQIEDLINSNSDTKTISIAWNVAESLKAMGVPYEEYVTNNHLDWSLPGLASIVRVFTNIYPSETQLKEFVKIAERHSMSGRQVVQEDQLIHIVNQDVLTQL